MLHVEAPLCHCSLQVVLLDLVSYTGAFAKEVYRTNLLKCLPNGLSLRNSTAGGATGPGVVPGRHQGIRQGGVPQRPAQLRAPALLLPGLAPRAGPQHRQDPQGQRCIIFCRHVAGAIMLWRLVNPCCELPRCAVLR